MPSLRRSLRTVCAAATLLAAGLAFAQSPAPQNVVGKIHVTGNSRFTTEQIAAAAGLSVGSPVDSQILNAAAGKLSASGAFAEVKYGYSFASKYWAIEFQVKESPRFVPATFDNFVWFSDDQLLAAAKKGSPLFDGNVPETGTEKDTVAGALTEFLKAQHMQGTVSAMPAAGASKDFSGYVYRVSDVQIPVLAVEVTGGPLDAKQLEAAERNIVGHDYSRYSANMLARSALAETYQNEGYLQPHFSSPVVAMRDPSGHDASRGVVVKMTVAAGKRYTWGGMTFAGNRALTAEKLTQLVGMAQGEIARRDKTLEGWKAVNREMGRNGYIECTMQATPAYDDAADIVKFAVQIDEGPQYMMGELKIDDSAPKVLKLVGEAWKIQRGQIYDVEAERKFMAEDGPRAVELSGTMRDHMSLHRTVHPETRTVDVHLEFQ